MIFWIFLRVSLYFLLFSYSFPLLSINFFVCSYWHPLLSWFYSFFISFHFLLLIDFLIIFWFSYAFPFNSFYCPIHFLYFPIHFVYFSFISLFFLICIFTFLLINFFTSSERFPHDFLIFLFISFYCFYFPNYSSPLINYFPIDSFIVWLILCFFLLTFFTFEALLRSIRTFWD